MKRREVDMNNYIWNKPFREEFLRNEDISIRQVAEAAGWMMQKTQRSGSRTSSPDGSQTRRKLGIIPDYRYLGGPCSRTVITYDEAVKLLPLFCFDPVDIGA